MMLRRLFLGLFLISSPLAPIYADDFGQDGFSYEQMRVGNVEVIVQNLGSDSAFSPSVVCMQMQTKTGNIFSQSEFDQDLKTLAAEYDKIEPSIEIVDRQVIVTLKIWLKPLIRSITFCGNEKIKTSKLEKELELDCAVPFERGEFLTKLNKVKMYYLKKGYFESELCYELNPVDCGSQVDIVINVDEGRAGHICEIRFQGATCGEEEELRELLMTHRYNRLFSWYTGWGFYHPEMIERDRAILLDYYQNRGFADADVAFCIEETHIPNRIVLVINVDKGAFYTIGSISFQGNTIFDDAKIQNTFDFCAGGVFSPERIRIAAKAIRDLYGSCGYIDANVDFQVCLHPESCQYDVNLVITEGEPFCVGMVRVFGNRCTKNRVILNENLLCPGEVFDIRKLEGTEARLVNTGFFEEVNVYAVSSNDEDCKFRDVFIEVEETDTGNIGLSLGANSLDSIFGGIDFCERNFNLAGLPLLFKRGPSALRGNGEYLHLKANIGQRQSVYGLQWTLPYFMDTCWLLGVDLEKNNNRLLSRGYELKTYGGRINGLYIVNHFLKYDLYYRGRHTRVVVRDSDNLFLAEEAKITGFVSAIGAIALYDSTGNSRRPCGGLRSRLSYELAGVGGNFEFMKFGYLNSFYYPMNKNGVLKLRADFQFIQPWGHTTARTMPLSEKLFLGGETTVRGYKNFIIGPKFGSNEPAGGISSYLLSEEYQHNLLKNPCLDAFVFCDAGYVSNSRFSIGRPAASVGFGFRVEVMRNMPITIGMGYPIHPIETLPNGEKFDNSQRFFFAVGGCF